MHASARCFADDVETGELGSAIEIGAHAAARIVRSRRNGNAVRGGVDAGRAARCGDRGKPLVEALAHMSRVEVHVIIDTGRALSHSGTDCRCNDIAWCEIFQRMHARHHPLAGRVVQDRTLATDCLADERLLPRWLSTTPQDRRVKLHELDVSRRKARAQRQGQAVAGDSRRVRRGREDLPISTGGDDDGPSRDDTD